MLGSVADQRRAAAETPGNGLGRPGQHCGLVDIFDPNDLKLRIPEPSLLVAKITDDAVKGRARIACRHVAIIIGTGQPKVLLSQFAACDCDNEMALRASPSAKDAIRTDIDPPALATCAEHRQPCRARVCRSRVAVRKRANAKRREQYATTRGAAGKFHRTNWISIFAMLLGASDKRPVGNVAGAYSMSCVCREPLSNIARGH